MQEEKKWTRIKDALLDEEHSPSEAFKIIQDIISSDMSESGWREFEAEFEQQNLFDSASDSKKMEAAYDKILKIIVLFAKTGNQENGIELKTLQTIRKTMDEKREIRKVYDQMVMRCLTGSRNLILKTVRALPAKTAEDRKKIQYFMAELQKDFERGLWFTPEMGLQPFKWDIYQRMSLMLNAITNEKKLPKAMLALSYGDEYALIRDLCIYGTSGEIAAYMNGRAKGLPKDDDDIRIRYSEFIVGIQADLINAEVFEGLPKLTKEMIVRTHRNIEVLAQCGRNKFHCFTSSMNDKPDTPTIMMLYNERKQGFCPKNKVADVRYGVLKWVDANTPTPTPTKALPSTSTEPKSFPVKVFPAIVPSPAKALIVAKMLYNNINNGKIISKMEDFLIITEEERPNYLKALNEVYSKSIEFRDERSETFERVKKFIENKAGTEFQIGRNNTRIRPISLIYQGRRFMRWKHPSRRSN